MITQAEVMRKRMIGVIMFQAVCINEVGGADDISIVKARMSGMLRIFNAALGEDVIRVTWEKDKIVTIAIGEKVYKWNEGRKKWGHSDDTRTVP